MKTLEFEPLADKKLVVIYVKKAENPTEKDVKDLKDLIMKYNPDFAAKELGNHSMDNFYKKDPYSNILKDAGVLVYPVDISEYAKTSISVMVDEKRRLADMVDASFVDAADSEYVKAYADYLRAEYEKLREKEDILIRNDWMVKGIIDCANKISKKEILCLFIGDMIHWCGMMEILDAIGAETCDASSLNITDIETFMKSPTKYNTVYTE